MWKLIDKDGKEISPSKENPYHTKNFRGNPITIIGGAPPHKVSSSGYIFHTGMGQRFYPQVANLKWIEE